MAHQEAKSISKPNQDKVCRLVIQQCLNAKLCFDTEDPPVSINAGMVIFVCFLQGATMEHLDNIVKAVLSAKLCEDPIHSTSTTSRESVTFHKLDILVIPQATLGGKLKGKALQYHGLVAKTLGEELFSNFIQKLKDSLESIKDCHIASGVYGARQILSMETNGPFTHVFEF